MIKEYYMGDIEIYIGNEKTATSIRESELEWLARVATSLKPSSKGESVTDSYIKALESFLSKQDEDDPYVIAYNKITNSVNGEYLLPLSIQLSLLEDFFRKHGIGQEEAERYNRTQSKYLEFIMAGNSLYEEGKKSKLSHYR